MDMSRSQVLVRPSAKQQWATANAETASSMSAIRPTLCNKHQHGNTSRSPCCIVIISNMRMSANSQLQRRPAAVNFRPVHWSNSIYLLANVTPHARHLGTTGSPTHGHESSWPSTAASASTLSPNNKDDVCSPLSCRHASSHRELSPLKKAAEMAGP